MTGIPVEIFRTLAVLWSVILVAACAAPAVTPAPTGGSGGTAGPRRGGTFVGVIAADPSATNRNTNSDSGTLFGFGGLYNSLIRLKPNSQVVPDLAVSWTVSPDGKRYEFKLPTNAKFHDGYPVTSDDVKYSFEEVAAKYQSQSIATGRNVERVETPDAATVVFVLKQPSPVFLMSLGPTNLVILPKRLYVGTDPRTNPHTTTTPVGSGPFKFKEWIKGDHISFVRNDAYFKPGLPYLDEYVVRIIPSGSSRALAFQKGDIDFINGQLVDRAQIPQLSATPGVQIDDHSGPPGTVFVEFNLKNKPFDDVRVRQAVGHAIDQAAIAQKAWGGTAVAPSSSHIERGLKEFFNPEVKLPAHDTQAANRLLDQAGYPKGPDGVRFKARLTFPTGNTGVETGAQIIRDNLLDAGIKVELTPMDQATISRTVFTNADFDMTTRTSTSVGDPQLGIASSYTTAGIGLSNGNAARYSNPEVDALFAKGATSLAVSERRAAYFKVQEILARDLPVFPLIDYQNVDFHSGRLGGVSETPLGFPFFHVEDIWLK